MVLVSALRGRREYLVKENLPPLPEDADLPKMVLEGMEKGARRTVALLFWKSLAGVWRDELTLHDPACGFGFEATAAAESAWDVTVYDPDAGVGKLRQEMLKKRWVGPFRESFRANAAVTFMDWDWEGFYNPQTGCLDMGPAIRAVEFMHYGLNFGSVLTVMKVPTKLSRVPLPGGYAHVVFPQRKTAYLLVAHTTRAEDAFVRLRDDLGTGVVRIVGSKLGGDASTGELESEDCLDCMPEKFPTCVHTAGGPGVLDGVFHSLAENIRRVFPAVSEVWNTEDFQKEAESLSFEKTGKVWTVAVGGTSGIGFFHQGGFVVPWHVTRGRDLVHGGKLVKCVSGDEDRDEAWYGETGTFPILVPGATVDVRWKGELAQGVLERADPYGVRFRSGPVHGNSGLPMTVDGKVIGVYANHTVVRGGFLTGPSVSDWVGRVVSLAQEERRLLVSVACGHGKTTRLPAALARAFGPVVVVEPRISIARSVAKYTGGRAFAEDDEINLGAGVNFITHGKMLQAALSGKDWIREVEVLVIDEAHDPTGMMSALRTWAHEEFPNRVVEMTASPKDTEFCHHVLGKSKYPTEVITSEPSIYSGGPWYDVEELSNKLGDLAKKRMAVMGQVPTKTFAGKVRDKLTLKGFEVAVLTSSSAKEKGLDSFVNWLTEGPGRIILCTDVVAYGVTLPVDAVVVQGQCNKPDGGFGKLVKARLRPLSKQDMLQWVGRVGRVRPGIAVIPTWDCRHSALTEAEKWTEAGYLLALGMSGKVDEEYSTVLSKWPKGALRKALLLPISFPASLGVVGPDERVRGSGPVARQAARNAGAEIVDDGVPYQVYADGRNYVKGFPEGLDPLMDKEWRESVLGKVQTSLFDFGLSAVVLPVILYALRCIGPGAIRDPVSVGNATVPVSKAPAMRASGPEVPLKVSRSQADLEHGDVLYDSVKTGLGDLVPKHVVDRVVAFIQGILDQLGLTQVSQNGVTVRFPFGYGVQARSVLYYLMERGREGEFTLDPNKPGQFLFRPTDKTMVSPVGLTDEGAERIETVSTSWSCVPTVSGVVGGVACLFAYVAYTWLRHGSHMDNTLGHRVAEFLKTVPTRQSRERVSRGLAGRYLVFEGGLNRFGALLRRGARGAGNAVQTCASSVIDAAQKAQCPTRCSIPIKVGGVVTTSVQIGGKSFFGLEGVTPTVDGEQVKTGGLAVLGSTVVGAALAGVGGGWVVFPVVIGASFFGLASVSSLVGVLSGWAVVNAAKDLRDVREVDPVNVSDFKELESDEVWNSTDLVEVSKTGKRHKTEASARSEAGGLIEMTGEFGRVWPPPVIEGEGVESGVAASPQRDLVVFPVVFKEGKFWRAGISCGGGKLDSPPTLHKDRSMLTLLVSQSARSFFQGLIASSAAGLVGGPTLGLAVTVAATSTGVGSLGMWARKCKWGAYPVLSSNDHAGFTDRYFEPSDTRIGVRLVGSYPRARDVLVMGVCGSPKWWAMLSEAWSKFSRAQPDYGLVLVTLEVQLPLALKALRCLTGHVSVIAVDALEPAAIRSARLLPWFNGRPESYYRVVDVDSGPSRLEFEDVAGPMVAYHPDGASVGPVCLSKTRVRGSWLKPHYDVFESQSAHWSVYGHDEVFANSLPGWKVILPRMNNLERRILRQSLPFNPDQPAVDVEVERERGPYAGPPLGIPRSKSAEPMRWNETGFWTKVAKLIADGELAPPDEFERCVVHTVSFNAVGRGVLAAARVAEDFVIGPLLVAGYGDADGLNTSPVALGAAFLSLSTMAQAGPEAYRFGRSLAAQDRSDARDGDDINQVRRDNMTLELRQKLKDRMGWYSVAGSFLACPVGALAGYCTAVLMGDDNRAGLTSSAALVFTGNPWLMAAGIAQWLASEGIARPLTTAIASTGAVCLHTGPVSVWDVSRQKLASATLQVPHLKANPQDLPKVFTKERQEPWITWRGQDVRSVTLPAGMVNETTSSVIALVRKRFIGVSGVRKTTVLGSGRGGIVQGLLHEGLRGSLSAYTLEEEGFVMGPNVGQARTKQSAVVTEILGDFLQMEVAAGDLVFVDSGFQADDVRIDLTQFDVMDEFWTHQSDSWRLGCQKTLPGGNVVIGVHVHPVYRLSQCVDEVSIHFKDVSVMLDPVSKTLGKAWVVGKGKRALGKLPLIVSDPREFTRRFEDKDVPGWTKFLSEYGQIISGKLNDPTKGNAWLAALHSLWKPPPSLVAPVQYAWSEPPCPSLGDAPRVVRAVLARYPPYPQLEGEWAVVGDLVPSNLLEGTGFRVVGTSTRKPIHMMEHVTGVDRVIASRVAQCGLGDVVSKWEIPSQSSGAANAGLFKRYDFQPVEEVSPSTASAFSVVTDMLVRKVKDHRVSLSAISVEEAFRAANKRSTMGYMSPLRGKQLREVEGEACAGAKAVLEAIQKGEGVRQMFHGSPKVEKKESDPEKTLVPRLFLYKEGTIRLAELAITRKVNKFLGSDGFLPASMKGDGFQKAETVVRAFERFSSPGAVCLESSKWDGHKSASLNVLARQMICTVMRAGGASSPHVEYLMRVAWSDTYGRAWLGSGTLVEFTGGCQKSGLWDTSVSNKLVNYCLALGLCAEALGKSVSEVLSSTVILIEGDDGLIIGEKEEIDAVAALRGEFYLRHGFPQRGDPRVAVRPEDVDFCSNGYTRVSSTGKCCPVRSLPDLVGKLLIPLRNGHFGIDNVSLARTLTATISLVAVYFALPEIRALWRYVREVVPKEVLVASIDPQEEFKVRWLLGDFDPVSFRLEDHVEKAWGCPVSLVGLDMDKPARDRAQAGRVGRLMEEFCAEACRVRLVRAIPASVNQWADTVKVWYHKSVNPGVIVEDLRWVFSKYPKHAIFVEDPATLREVSYRVDLGELVVGYCNSAQFLGKCPGAKGIMVFDRASLAEKRRAETMWTEAERRKLGHRAELEFFVAGSVRTSGLGLYVSGLVLGLVGAGVASLWAWLSSRSSSKVADLDVRVKNVEEPERLGGSTVTCEEPGGFEDLAHMCLLNAQWPSFARADCEVTARELAEVCGVSGLATKRNGKVTLEVLRRDAQMFVKTEWKGKLDPKLKIAGQVREEREWRGSGGTVSLASAIKQHPYPQMERIAWDLFRSGVKDASLVIRLSDSPVISKSGLHPEPRLFPGARSPSDLSRLPGAVVGLSSSPSHKDISCAYGPDPVGEPCPWPLKEDVVLWRGGVTGFGSTPLDNQRMHLLSVSRTMELPVPLDVGVTSREIKPRVGSDLTIGQPDVRSLKIRRVPKETWEQQSGSKYLLVVEGHDLPDRIPAALSTGSVVLVAKPKRSIGTKLWFSDLLLDWVNCVFVEHDFRDLRAVLERLTKDQRLAQTIGKEGRSLGLSLGKAGPLWLQSLVFASQHPKGQEAGESQAVAEEVQGHKVALWDPKSGATHGSALDLGAAPARWSICQRDLGCGVSIFRVSPEQAQKALSSRIGARVRHGDLTPAEDQEGADLCQPVWAEMEGRVGSLGSGNHFSEVGRDSAGNYYLSIHSGSRGLGEELRKAGGFGIQVPIGIEQGQNVVSACSTFAKYNRRVVARIILGEDPGKPFVDTVQNGLMRKESCRRYGFQAGVRFNLLDGPERQAFLLGKGVGISVSPGVPCLWPHGIMEVRSGGPQVAVGKRGLIIWTVGYVDVI